MRGSRKLEGTTQHDLLQLHENNSRFEKGFGEIYCVFGGCGGGKRGESGL